MSREKDIEKRLIDRLVSLQYKWREDIRDLSALDNNFRAHFEKLNDVHLTDEEFHRLCTTIVTPHVYECATRLRETNTFEREDGTPLHYRLLNTADWCKNSFEVVNQLRINTRSSHQRYDVILLINGLPLVQIELKSHELSPRRAIQQIVEYKHEPGNGYENTLLAFMQLFIVSNEHDTFYFANNDKKHFAFDTDERFLPICHHADQNNNKIDNLYEFADSFLARCTLARIISRYMVLVATEQQMLIMRPYQIYAVQHIVTSIKEHCGNGYVWHTTGSGKTLTSFKASTLLKENTEIAKCLFVVDRKDLDRQTRREFNRFQENCVEENTDTATLVTRLLSKHHEDKIIVTTIQKLGRALSNRQDYATDLASLRDMRMVFIFDECHRSQFGEYRKAITEFFPKAQLFGFTGTPIFEENASYHIREDTTKKLVTTEDIFPHCLHKYTITHAIEDENVLRFRVEYFARQDEDASYSDEQKKPAIVDAILKKHDANTSNRRFNALFATASINDAIAYYKLFQSKQQSDRPLNIACLFSPPTDGNADNAQLQEDLLQEKEDYKHGAPEKKKALQEIVGAYNTHYETDHSLDRFDNYYQDVQKRITDQQYKIPREQKIDITIVVDMLLTGFDSKHLNTLYVDKNLRYHSLIQAFSRTNRILNATKPHGNIIDFRRQATAVDEAIKLFSGASGEEGRNIWLVKSAAEMCEQYQEQVSALNEFMREEIPSQQVSELDKFMPPTPDQVGNLKGDAKQAEFVQLFRKVQRTKIQLDQYTDLSEKQQKKIKKCMPDKLLEGFRARYLEIARRIKEQQEWPADYPLAGDALQEEEFEYVLFSSVLIDYDYIMRLIADAVNEPKGIEKATKEQIVSLIQSDAKFMDDSQYLRKYIDTLKPGTKTTKERIKNGFEKFKDEQILDEFKNIAKKHGIEFALLKTVVENVCERGALRSDELDKLLERLPLSWKEREKTRMHIVRELGPVFKKMIPGQQIGGLEVYEDSPTYNDD